LIGFGQQQPQQLTTNNTGFGQQPQQLTTNNTGFGQEGINTGFRQQQPTTNTTGFGQQPQQQPPLTNTTGFGQQQPTTNTTGFGQQQLTNTTGFGQQPQQQPPLTNTTGFGEEDSDTGIGQKQLTNNTGIGQKQLTNNTGIGQKQLTNNTGNAQQQKNNTGNATGLDAKGILAVHNRERAAVGVPPLVWSDKLAAHAKVWADTLAAGKNVGGPHDREAFAKFGEGENIVTHPGAVTTAEMINMIESWVAEKANYHGRFTGNR